MNVDLIAVDAATASKAERQAQLARDRRERYEAKVRGTDKDVRERKRRSDARLGITNHHAADEPHYRDYEFVMWDGEAPTDTGYSLFGSSLGHEICKPHLTTEECFDLLLEAKRENPQTIFFWFGGRYDWDEITRQSIPLQKLARLKNAGSLWWHHYRLTEIEGKVYTIAKNGTTVTIYEVSGWFHCPYASALRKYGIGCEDCTHGNKNCAVASCECRCVCCRIELGKSSRGNDETFTWDEIQFITEYMRLELSQGPYLMDCIRRICLNAGFDLKGWYGPSALARKLLTMHKVKKAMAICPDEVNLAAQFAFAGGRFEPFRGGIFDRPIVEKDKNSAYMHAALDLPNLARGTWRKGCEFEPGKFAVYHIRYTASNAVTTTPHPLFRRLPNGTVCWPGMVEGWYWSPEAELVADSPDACFKEAWIFDEDDMCDRPFAFVRDVYAQRLHLQSLPSGDPAKEAELAFKWALASIYGQLCRLVGWDAKRNLPPETHQLEWAGYITSHCRAAMWKLAVRCGSSLVSIDTDSVTAFADGDVAIAEGNQLGEWKVTRSDGGIYFQSGVYFTRKGDVWSKGKTRGMERRRGTPAVSPEILAEAIRTGQRVRLTPKRTYVTTRMALNGQLENHGQWRDHPGNVLEFGGGGKRYHSRKNCERKCSGSVHVFSRKLVVGRGGAIWDVWSSPHWLPWKNPDEYGKLDAKLLADILWVNAEEIDSDDYWLVELVNAAIETGSSHLVRSELRTHRAKAGAGNRQHNALLGVPSGQTMATSIHPGNVL